MSIVTAVRYVYEPYVCVYCGEPADELDHLLPASWTGTAQRRAVPTVPSCSECNKILSDRLDPEVTDRRDYVHSQLRIKYYKQLRAYPYTDAELETFEPNLRSKLLVARVLKKNLEARLAWPLEPSYDIEAYNESVIQQPTKKIPGKSGHVTWHVRRGIIKEGCAHCDR